LEADHRVSLPTPGEEVSDLISMAPSLKELTNSEFCKTEEELD
jgi:hypothetical protein